MQAKPHRNHTSPPIRRAVLLGLIVAILLGTLSGCSASAETVEPSASAQPNEQARKPDPAPEAPAPPEKEATPPAPEKPEPPAPEQTPAKPASAAQVTRVAVTQIVDGDTIRVRMPDGTIERIRFIGVDTPESTNRIEPYGKEASAFTAKALSGKSIYLETDVGLRDKYGRMLAHIWLEPPTQINQAEVRSKLFNAILLLNGYARLMTIPPNVKYVDYLKDYEAEARDANRGLWALGGSVGARTLPAPKQAPAPSGNAAYVGSIRSDVFHYPNCTSAKKIKPANLVTFPTREAAVAAGRRPCKNCNP